MTKISAISMILNSQDPWMIQLNNVKKNNSEEIYNALLDTIIKATIENLETRKLDLETQIECLKNAE